MGICEDNFPRGGQTLNTAKPEKTITLFGKNEHKNKSAKTKATKRQREKNASIAKNSEKADKEITAKTAEALSYKSISEGMVVLGCIHKVNEMAVQISLPGRIYGLAMVTNISGPYTNTLQKLVDDPQGNYKDHKTLKTLFKPGQYVCAKVLSPDDLNEYDINLSLSPSETHSGIKHVDIVKGSVHMVAVQSIEDHGYVIDIGVPNCRAFLPNKEVPQEFGRLGIGELVWCAVNKVSSTSVATTINLTAMKEKITKCALVGDDVTLHKVMPGMSVEVTVDKILPNGLQVKFLQNFYGYISESHLQKVNDELLSYSKDQTIQAIVLYIMPVSKLTYLTMRDLETVTPSDKIKVGDVLNGKVVSRTGKGIYFKISKYSRGFITYKRIKTKSGAGENEIAIKYAKGSSHNIRVLSFDYMDNVYICSNETDLLKEKLFSITDLKPGQIVSAVVQSVSSKGILVHVGKITGLITHLHISDIPIKSASISSRFAPQQVVKARVLRISEEKTQLYLTMKPSLMDSSIAILSSYDEAQRNKRYKGAIVQVLSNGLVVAFFNDVKGFVPRSQFAFRDVKDPRDVFYIGQVVECSTLNYDKASSHLTLTLKRRNYNESRTQITLGQRVTGIIKNKNDLGLHVMVGDSECFLPTIQLSQSRSLGEVMLGIYDVGDKIDNLICVKADQRNPILSLCEGRTIYGDSQDETSNTSDMDMNLENLVTDFKDFEKGLIIKGWVHNVTNKHILIRCPSKNFKRCAVVQSSEILDSPVENLHTLNLVQHQPLVLKVKHINQEDKNVVCSAKLSEVWDLSTQPSIDILMSYLNDVYTIHQSWKLSGRSLGGLNIGQRVQAIVKSVSSTSVILELPNKLEAIAQAINCSASLKIGESVLCVILWLDFINNCAEVSIDKKVINRISENQDANKQLGIVEGSTLRCEILLVRQDFIIGVLRGSGSKHIAFMPTYRHINDLFPVINDYLNKKIVKVTIISIKHGHAVCVLKDRLTQEIKYAKQKVITRKRRRTESLQNDCSVENSTKQMQKNILLKNSNSEKSDSECDETIDDSEQEENVGTFVKIEKRKKLEQNFIESDEPISKKSKKNSKVTSQHKDEFEEISKPGQNIKEKESVDESETKMEYDDESEIKMEYDDESEDETLISLKGNGLLEANNFFSGTVDNLKQNTVSSSSSDESDVENEKVKKKKKKLTTLERQAEMRQQEELLRQDELKLAASYDNPQTADHFDRLLLANPDNSLTWINYMAYHLQATEIEKARAVARKALSSISFREEQDKMNIWIALLNLENRYGTKESFSEVLEEAVKMNDAREIYMQVLQILAESSKIQDLSDMINKVLKKYKSDVDTWVNAGLACFKAGLVEKARQIMQKGLSGLENKQHVDLIVRFSSLENRFGHSERAQALIEQVLTSYPKRIDIWSQYIDMLVKTSQIAIAREVLDRAVSQKLPARKMKTLFKKFLDFEAKFGDESSVAKVRDMATEYVKNATN